MSRYDRQIAQATRMIVKYGQACVWRKLVSTADPTQPWKEASNVQQDFNTSILFLRPSGGLANALFHLIKGTDAPSGAPRGLMAASLAFTPDMTDQVIKDGKVLVVKSFNVVAPSGVPILYDIEFA